MKIYQNAVGNLQAWGLPYLLVDNKEAAVAAFSNPQDAQRFLEDTVRHSTA